MVRWPWVVSRGPLAVCRLPLTMASLPFFRQPSTVIRHPFLSANGHRLTAHDSLLQSLAINDILNEATINN